MNGVKERRFRQRACQNHSPVPCGCAVVGAVHVGIGSRRHVIAGPQDTVEHVNRCVCRVLGAVHRLTCVQRARIGGSCGETRRRPGDHSRGVNEVVAVGGVLNAVEIDALPGGTLGAIRGMHELTERAPLRWVLQSLGIHRSVSGGTGGGVDVAVATA